MPHHAIICLDNSEYMRNGDITPNRLEAQQVAAMKQCNRVLEGPESTVGVLKMSGDYPKLLLALGRDKFNIRAELGSCEIDGDKIQLINSLKKAYLAVKKRSDDDVGDRSIFVFIGSPIKGIDQDEFMKLAGRLRKSNIAITFVNFAGEEALVPNQEILQQFIERVNKDNNSKLESVPPGPHILADMISQDQGGSSSNQFDFDEDMDPALAAALRLSLMESQGIQPDQQGNQPQQPQQPQQDQNEAMVDEEDFVDPDMDDDLAMAIRLSLQEEENRKRQEQGPQETGGNNDEMQDEDDDENDDDEEDDFELQQALAMSMMSGNDSGQPKDDVNTAVEDEDFLADVVGNLPGVKKDNKSDEKPMEDDDNKDDDKKKDDSKK